MHMHHSHWHVPAGYHSRGPQGDTKRACGQDHARSDQTQLAEAGVQAALTARNVWPRRSRCSAELVTSQRTVVSRS